MTKRKPPNELRKAGRPTLYTVELAADICTQMALGKATKAICAQEGMPSLQSVFLWLSDKASKPEFSEMYARAREMRAEHIYEETLEISDSMDGDFIEDAKGNLVANHARVQRDRLRVDTRKWFLSKLDPRRYGEKQQIEHSGALTLDTIIRESYGAKPEEKKP